MDRQSLLESILVEDIKVWSKLDKVSLLHTLVEHRLAELENSDVKELIKIRKSQIKIRETGYTE